MPMPSREDILLNIKFTKEGEEVITSTRQHFKKIHDQIYKVDEKWKQMFSPKGVTAAEKISESLKPITEKGAFKEILEAAGVEILGDKQLKAMKNMGKSTEKLGKIFKSWNILSITLPLMFGFQNIAKAMKSAIDPALDLVGANQLYQEFLAVKYLPTALEQLDNVVELGEGWLEQGEATRKAEGDMILWVDRVSEAIQYTSQMVMTFGALGKVIPIFGERIGNAAGLAVGLTSSLALLSNEGGQTMVTFGGISQAAGIAGSDLIAKFATKVGIIKDTELPSLSLKTAQTAEDIKTIGTATGENYISEIVKGVGNQAEVQTKLDELSNRFSTTFSKIASIVKGETTGTTPQDIINAVAAAQELGKIVAEAQRQPKGKIRSILEGTPIGRFFGRILPIQEGGVVTRPTLGMVGEAGPEAIIPLNRAGMMFGDTNVYVNITGGINSSLDVDMVANTIASRVREDLRSSIGM